MSIHSNKGTVEIDGKGEDILTEFLKEEKNDHFKSILKKLGLEG